MHLAVTNLSQPPLLNGMGFGPGSKACTMSDPAMSDWMAALLLRRLFRAAFLAARSSNPYEANLMPGVM